MRTQGCSHCQPLRDTDMAHTTQYAHIHTQTCTEILSSPDPQRHPDTQTLTVTLLCLTHCHTVVLVQLSKMCMDPLLCPVHMLSCCLKGHPEWCTTPCVSSAHAVTGTPPRLLTQSPVPGLLQASGVTHIVSYSLIPTARCTPALTTTCGCMCCLIQPGRRPTRCHIFCHNREALRAISHGHTRQPHTVIKESRTLIHNPPPLFFI